MTRTKTNEEGTSWVEVFKKWLEENNHISTLEFVDWKSEENEIEIDFVFFKPIRDWVFVYKNSAWDAELLLYKWFDNNITKIRSVKPYYEEIKEIEQELINLARYKKWKKRGIIFGAVALVIVLSYLAWPKSEKESTTWNYV